MDGALDLDEVQGRRQAAGEVAREAEARAAVQESAPVQVDLGLESPDAHDPVPGLLRRLRRQLGVEMAGLLSLQGDGALHVEGFEGARHRLPRRLMPSGWFLGRILESGEPQVKRAADLDHVQHPLVEGEGIRSMAGVPVRAEGEVAGVLVVASRSDHDFGAPDLEALRQAAERAAGAIERVRTVERERAAGLLAVAGRDLTAALAAVQAQLGRLPTLAAAPEKHARAVAVAERGLRRLGLLVEDALDLARLEGGNFALRPVPLDLAPLAAAALDAWEGEAALRGVRLGRDLPDALPARGDRERLRHVLATLLDDAVRRTPPGGTVTLRGRNEQEEAVLEVHDGGQGAAASLGVHLARAVAERHGGSLEVRPTGVVLRLPK